VAVHLGYRANMEEGERKKFFTEASRAIKDPEGFGLDAKAQELVKVSLASLDPFEEHEAGLEKEAIALAKQLPIAEWVKKPERRGFALGFLAMVVGECGNLANYSTPTKMR